MAVFSGNGSNTAPSFTFSSDTNTGMYRQAADILAFSTAGSDQLVLDGTGGTPISTFTGTVGATTFSGGRVILNAGDSIISMGRGVTDSDDHLFYGQLYYTGVASDALRLINSRDSNIANGRGIGMTLETASGVGARWYNQGQGTANNRASYLTTVSGTSERTWAKVEPLYGDLSFYAPGRTDSSDNGAVSLYGRLAGSAILGAYVSASGRVGIGGSATSSAQLQVINPNSTGLSSIYTTTNSTTGQTSHGLRIVGDGFYWANGSSTWIILEDTDSNAARTANYLQRFIRNGVAVGGISTSTTNTAFADLSDYRLKENVTIISDAIERVKQLKPCRYNFISNPETTMDGFLAHEVQQVIPEAVSGEKDQVGENGEINPQMLDRSKMVPLLTAALQAAISRIEALEAALGS